MAYKQQGFISHSSGGREGQDQGACRFNVCRKLTSWFIDNSLLQVTSRDRTDKGPPVYKGTNPIHEYSTLVT